MEKFMAFFSWIRTLVTGHQTIENIPFERWNEEWTEPLRNLIKSNLSILETASDITKIYPTFHSLSTDNKITILTQFIKGICWFESAFNPKISCVDVGNGNDKDTWSVGLMQMSVVDQKNYNFHLGYTYEDLKDPIKNLILAIGVLVNQIKNKGKILIPLGEKGTYWATIHPKGMYDKSASILNVVHQLKFDHTMDTPKDKSATPVEEKKSETPWLDWFIDRLGWTEYTHDKELSKGWALSKYCKNYKTVIGKEHSWCGISGAMAMQSCGYKYPLQCETAFEWIKYGTPIDWKKDGIPRGAIIVLKESHLCFCFEDHKPGPQPIKRIGGNQNSSVNVKDCYESDIYAVRWPVK